MQEEQDKFKKVPLSTKELSLKNIVSQAQAFQTASNAENQKRRLGKYQIQALLGRPSLSMKVEPFVEKLRKI